MSVRQKKQELLEAMHRARAMEPSSFVPNKLLDTLIQRMQLKNDAELCRVLEVQPPIISKIRHRKLNVGATILLRMHEKSNISIRELKELTAASRGQEGQPGAAQAGGPASTHAPNRTHH